MFSDGKVVDDVLKRRLEMNVFSWLKEMKIMLAVKPEIILEDPQVTYTQCKILKIAFYTILMTMYIEFTYRSRVLDESRRTYYGIFRTN